MDNVYTLNPYPLPEKPGRFEQHKKGIATTIVAIIAIVAIAVVVYVWKVTNEKQPIALTTPTSTVDPQTELRNNIANILKTDQVQASTQEINSMAAILKKSSKTSNSSAVSAQEMATLLKNN